MATKTLVEFEVKTLADLIEVCQAIHNETGNVDPSEIYIQSSNSNRIWIQLASHTLTDGSTVYDAEVA